MNMSKPMLRRLAGTPSQIQTAGGKVHQTRQMTTASTCKDAEQKSQSKDKAKKALQSGNSSDDMVKKVHPAGEASTPNSPLYRIANELACIT